jgi:hypothetical protein
LQGEVAVVGLIGFRPQPRDIEALERIKARVPGVRTNTDALRMAIRYLAGAAELEGDEAVRRLAFARAVQEVSPPELHALRAEIARLVVERDALSAELDDVVRVLIGPKAKPGAFDAWRQRVGKLARRAAFLGSLSQELAADLLHFAGPTTSSHETAAEVVGWCACGYCTHVPTEPPVKGGAGVG